MPMFESLRRQRDDAGEASPGAAAASASASGAVTAPRHWLALLLAVLVYAPCPEASAQDENAAESGTPAVAAPERPESAAVNERVSIPLHGAGLFGGDAQMATQVFRPVGPGPFPVVVFSHGRAPDAAGRAHLKIGISRAQLRYWLARGDAVVAPIRPGYGATGGGDPESSGSHFDAFGHCTTTPDYRRTARAERVTVEATLAWLRSQPWADAHRVLLAGQSAGGLTTVAAAAAKPEGVVGYINYAGGNGGSPSLSPGHSCDPDQLTAIYGEFGMTTTVPSLWLYATNDQYFGPDAPVAWYASFARGGSKTAFVHAPPVADGNGHGLSSHAARLWAPYVDAFLATIPFDAPLAAGSSGPDLSAPDSRPPAR